MMTSVMMPVRVHSVHELLAGASHNSTMIITPRYESMPPRMAFGTTLPTSMPENRIMAQTMPTMAPDHRVVAPDSSSRMQAFIDSEPPNPPKNEAKRLASPFERNS